MLVLSAEGPVVVRRVARTTGLGIELPEPARGEGAAAALSGWAARYRGAVSASAEAEIFRIGEEMFAWLDQGGGLTGWLEGAERVLEVRAGARPASELAEALLAAPWEALVAGGRFLASEARLFTVARRCGGGGEPVRPPYADLSLMFMAASPAGQHVLDYEREEAAILAATTATKDRPPLAHVEVEESGALAFLAERLQLDESFDALHLSCHGDIVEGEGPVLLLERAEGGADRVGPDRLVKMINKLPPLVFVSACRTAERGAGGKGAALGGEGIKEGGFAEAAAGFAGAARDAGAGAEVSPDLADPFVRELAGHAANVIGWDGSVRDVEATLFAEALYGALARGETVPRAAALARRELFDARTKDPRLGRHWHLARVYLGPGGGGALVDPQARRRPARAPAEKPFLDPKNKQVPVASRQEFVGRREQIQAVIRAYREGERGVLVHGMGNLGKSSLAARVADRMPHFRTALVFGRCSAQRIFAALKQAVEAIADGMNLADAEVLREELEAAEQKVAKSGGALREVVRRLLRGVLNEHPVLLILDDFEQSLEPPSAAPGGGGGLVPKPDYREALQGLFEAFRDADTLSRLLVTSRFDFTLPDGAGGDLAAGLVRVPLTSMRAREQAKQWQAKARAQGKEKTAAEAGTLMDKAVAAAAGNPGLQDVLTRPILQGETAAAEAAIARIETFRSSGKVPPAGDDLGDFFERMAFKTYAGALTGSERTALGAACLFTTGLPVPRAALAAVAGARGLADPARALDRLLGLGLLDDWGMMSGWPGETEHRHVAANPLARHLGEAVSDEEGPALAAVAMPCLAAAWRDREGDFPYDARAVEATRLGLLADPPNPDLLEAAATAAIIHLFDRSYDAQAAVALAREVLDVLARAGRKPMPVLIGKTILAAERIGDTALQDQLLDEALARDDIEPKYRAQLQALRADRLMWLGDLDGALAILERELLPAFEALSNRRSVAMTKGKITDILQMRGDLDGALAIRKREQLPVYEALGDRRELAVTKGRIADILQVRGNLDGALEIRKREQLPVYEALGDRRSVAVTRGRIADILQMRGDLDGALAIRKCEQLPVYEALGDRRSAAITKGQIADILQMRGDLDGALAILESEVLSAFEALGDRRSVAVTKGKIADILQMRGDLKGALALHLERLPIAQEMQDLDSVAHIRFSCARIRLKRGDHERGGLDIIHREVEEAFAAFVRLGRPDGIAASGWLLGQVLAMGGYFDEAARVLEIAAASFDKLGDAEGAADCRALIQEIKKGQT